MSYIKSIFIILSIFMAAVIETDIYLPAFPVIMAHYHIDGPMVQSLLSINFLGLCLSSLCFGFLSDLYGRKQSILSALYIFLLGSLLALWEGSFSLLQSARFIQGIGAGGCFSIGTALIFDLFRGKKAVSALNLMNSIVPIFMTLAPMLGSALTLKFGFRANFFAIALSLIPAILAAHFGLQSSTFPKNSPRPKVKLNDQLASILKSSHFWGATLMVILLFAGYLQILAGLSILYTPCLDVPFHLFPLHQGSILLGYLLASLSGSFLLKFMSENTLKRLGISCALASAIFLIATSYLYPKSPWHITAALTPYAFGFIWAQTIYLKKMMGLFENNKGALSSLLTFIRLLLSSTLLWLGGLIFKGNIYSLTVLLTLIVLVTLIIALVYEKSHPAPRIIQKPLKQTPKNLT